MNNTQRVRKQDKAILKIAANTFKFNLENKDFLYVVQGDDYKYYTYKLTFHSSNFMHLTGIFSQQKPYIFLQKCLTGDLNDKSYIYNRYTIPKIQHLVSALKMIDSPTYIATFNQKSNLLQTTLLIGDDEKAIGMLKSDSSCYSPNSLLITDIRQHDHVLPIIGILKKSRKDQLYKKLTIMDDSFDFTELGEDIRQEIDFDKLSIRNLQNDYDLVREYIKLPNHIKSHIEELNRLKQVSMKLDPSLPLEISNRFIEKCTDLMMWDNADSQPVDFYIGELLNAIQTENIDVYDILYASNYDLLNCIYNQDYHYLLKDDYSLEY